jgi:superkiller protein 3
LEGIAVREGNEQPVPTIDRYTRGILHFREGRLAEAADELLVLLGRGDAIGCVARYFYAAAERGLAAKALRATDLAAAERHVRMAMAATGRDCSLPGCVAAFYAQSGRREDCCREMDRLVGAGGDGADERRKLAQAQWRAGHQAEAYMTLTEALRRFGDCGRLHLQMGLFLSAEGRYDEARASLERAAEADCDDPDAHRYLALTAAAQGDLAAAVYAFQRSLDLRPTDSLLARQLLLSAKAAADSGLAMTIRLPAASELPRDGGLADLAEYVAAEPDVVEALLALPESLADEELFALLAAVLDLAISACPTYADLHLLSSRVLARLGQLDAAIGRARGALSLNGRFVRARVQLAELYAQAGRTAEAAGQMTRAVADGADWPDVHLRAGELLRRCGHVERARQHFRRALEINGQYAAAAKGLASLAA